MTHCYLGLGSNLNSPKRQLHLALNALKKLPKTYILKTSPFYQTTPFGVVGQPMYCNAVVLLETHLSPEKILSYTQAIEHHQKRVRNKRWGSRTLDIDVLLYGTRCITTPNLSLPHPRLHERAFVLIPLLNLWPDAALPNGTSLKTCLQKLNTQKLPDVVPIP